MYYAMTELGLTEKQFWDMSPFLFDSLLEMHARKKQEERRALNGR